MAHAARAGRAAGADLIDINMGCPARRVAGALAGSALMRDLDAAARSSKRLSRAPVPVTLKTRLGWDEDLRNAAELASRAEARRGGDDHRPRRARAASSIAGAADWAAVARSSKRSISRWSSMATASPRGRARDAGRYRARSGGDDRPRGGRRAWLVGAISARARPPAASRAARRRDGATTRSSISIFCCSLGSHAAYAMRANILPPTPSGGRPADAAARR